MGLPRFLAELKRRKVYRVALVYAAVGWAILEASGMVLPRLALPDWTVNMVLAVVLLGFPLALVFAWIFDISPEGIVRTEPLDPAEHPHRFSIAAIVEFVLIVALVAVVGGLYVDRLSLQKRLTEAESAAQGSPGTSQPAIPLPEQYRSIAVLPFADMSEAGDQAWFAEGIAEELLIALSQVKPLSVKARTSSFAFKGTDKTIAEIADILGVQAVLEGSVRRSKDRVRVTAQLVDAHSGFHIWSGSYERQLTDIFQMQDELAKSVIEALRIELALDDDRVLVAQQTESLAAYSWFMRGRALSDWANPQNTLKGITYFENAVEADPDYAQAWGYLAWMRAQMVFWKPTAEIASAVVEAYEKALRLDSAQSEALTAKAWMTYLLDWDLETAFELCQRAISRNDNTNSLLWYNMFLVAVDGLPRAVINQQKIIERDPLHAGYKATLANFLIYAGEPEAALKMASAALKLNPQHLFALGALIEANTVLGNFSAVEEALDTLSDEQRQWPSIKVREGLYYAERRNFEKVRQIYEELLLDPRAVNFFGTSLLALRLGKVEEALDHLERLVEARSWLVFGVRSPYYLKTFPTFRKNPRYLALLKRIGSDDESIARLRSRFAID